MKDETRLQKAAQSAAASAVTLSRGAALGLTAGDLVRALQALAAAQRMVRGALLREGIPQEVLDLAVKECSAPEPLDVAQLHPHPLAAMAPVGRC